MGNFLVPWTRQAAVACGRAPAAGRRLHRAAALGLIGCALLPLLAGGCGNGETRVVEIDARLFKSVVLQSKQPVLINFYKDG